MKPRIAFIRVGLPENSKPRIARITRMKGTVLIHPCHPRNPRFTFCFGHRLVVRRRRGPDGARAVCKPRWTPDRDCGLQGGQKNPNFAAIICACLRPNIMLTYSPGCFEQTGSGIGGRMAASNGVIEAFTSNEARRRALPAVSLR